MKVSELFGNAGISYPQEIKDIEIKEIITDSRRACEGCAFICIKGLTHDGHDHIDEVVKAGAKVIVAEQERNAGVGGAAAIFVDNSRRSAALLYNSWYGDPSREMKLVAVTGTNGKTSVSYMLKRIFEEAGYKCGLVGTVECLSGSRALDRQNRNPLANMTTPDPEDLYRLLADMKKDGVEYVFIEATSHALSLFKLDGLRFDTVVLTNFTQDHLDFHGDMNGYFEAKARILKMCERAIINIDDDWSEKFIERADCKIYTTSAKASADYRAENIRYMGVDGSLFSLNGETEVSVSMPGRFFVNNALQAAAVADIYGISPQRIASAIESMKGISGRMERVELPDPEIHVFIDYAHTPDAMENVLRSVKEFGAEKHRTVVLFGCGGDRDRSKRPQMAQIASRLADFIIITSDNSRNEAPRQIFGDILKGIDKEKEFILIEDRKKAIEYAIENAKEGDVIVLAGKGHEHYEINFAGKHFFDEREIVRGAYAKRKRISMEVKDEGNYRL